MNTYKTITKSILPLLLVMGLVGMVQAQIAPITNTMTGTAQLVDNITIDPATGDSATVDFGQVLTNVTSAIFLDPKGANNTNVGNNASFGVFKIGGSPGTNVSIGFDPTVTMSGANNTANSINWIPALTYDQSSPISQSGSADLSNGQEINLNANDLHLFIGGNLVGTGTGASVETPWAGGEPTPDIYSGNITITVTIN